MEVTGARDMEVFSLLHVTASDDSYAGSAVTEKPSWFGAAY